MPPVQHRSFDGHRAVFAKVSSQPVLWCRYGWAISLHLLPVSDVLMASPLHGLPGDRELPTVVLKLHSVLPRQLLVGRPFFSLVLAQQVAYQQMTILCTVKFLFFE